MQVHVHQTVASEILNCSRLIKKKVLKNIHFKNIQKLLHFVLDLSKEPVVVPIEMATKTTKNVFIMTEKIRILKRE